MISFDFKSNQFTTITYDDIEKHVIEFSNVSKKQIQNKPSSSDKRGRYRENEQICFARQLCHYFSRKYIIGASFRDIGERFGKRDHASVMHSCKAVKNLKETNKKGFLYIYMIEHNIKKDDIDFATIPQY